MAFEARDSFPMWAERLLAHLVDFENLSNLTMLGIDIRRNACDVLAGLASLRHLSLHDCPVYEIPGALSLTSFECHVVDHLYDSDRADNGTATLCFDSGTITKVFYGDNILFYNYLRCFETSLIPIHPQLTEVTLDVMGISWIDFFRFVSRCPELRKLSVSSLDCGKLVAVPASFVPELTSFSGPATVAVLLVQGRPLQSLRILNDNPVSGFDLDSYSSQLAAAGGLCELHVEVIPDAVPHLLKLASAFPNLKTLGLLVVDVPSDPRDTVPRDHITKKVKLVAKGYAEAVASAGSKYPNSDLYRWEISVRRSVLPSALIADFLQEICTHFGLDPTQMMSSTFYASPASSHVSSH
jgi:hypothetical protein